MLLLETGTTQQTNDETCPPGCGNQYNEIGIISALLGIIALLIAIYIRIADFCYHRWLNRTLIRCRDLKETKLKKGYTDGTVGVPVINEHLSYAVRAISQGYLEWEQVLKTVVIAGTMSRSIGPFSGGRSSDPYAMHKRADEL